MTTDAAARPFPSEEEWSDGMLRLFGRVLDAEVDGDLEQTVAAFQWWHEWAAEHGCDHDGGVAAMVVSLAAVASIGGAPCVHGAPGSCDGSCEGPVGVVVEDPRTGEIVADPDAEVEDDDDAAALLASRMIVAKMNDDGAAAYSLFHGSTPEVGFRTMLIVARMAAGSYLDKGEREGTLTPEVAEKWAARKAEAEKDAPEIRGPVEVREHDGVKFTSIEPDERDRHPDDREALVAPHGQALYAVTAYPATAGQREAYTAMIHEQIRGWAASGSSGIKAGTELCGVAHVEEIEPWQLPHTGRPSANRVLRSIKRQTGIPGQLLRGWQHHGGTCPDVKENQP